MKQSREEFTRKYEAKVKHFFKYKIVFIELHIFFFLYLPKT